MRRPFVALAAACLLLASLPNGAAAQDAGGPGEAPPPQPSQGPMGVEQVHNGFAVAADFRFSTVDGSPARLAGGYGGWLIDNTLLIGGGGYWLTNRSSAPGMAYGGAVVAWLQRTDRRLGFGARTLVGFGEARLSNDFSGVASVLDRDGHMGLVGMDGGRPFLEIMRGDVRTLAPGRIRVTFREHFFVAEPQADLLVNLTRRLRLDVGVGYRLIGGADGFDHQLRGLSGSVALQMGGSKYSRR